MTARGLERRLKRHVYKAQQNYFAVCAPGTEALLYREVLALPGVVAPQMLPGGVEFSGSLELLYHAHLQLRCAHRVLLRLEDFLAQSYPMLFNKALRLPWEHYLGFTESYSLRVSAKASRLRHHKRLAETLQSAISQALAPLGLQPQQQPQATLELHVRMFQDRCSLSLNSSGAHLHQRGYHQQKTRAPLRETLAASLLEALDMHAYTLILDPMCGSGTLLCEAAQRACGLPAGHLRRFAFEALPFFQASKWQRLRTQALSQQHEATLSLYGTDIDPAALQAAKHNAHTAGVAELIHWQHQDARVLPYTALLAQARQQHQRPTAPGLVLCNPPYGRRLGNLTETRQLYQTLLEAWQQQAQGYDIALLTPHRAWLEDSPLRWETLLHCRNGGIPVYLLRSSLR